MTTKEIIKELKAISEDLLDSKIDYSEAINGIGLLSEHTGIEFTVLYNAFYSSNPEIYFNK